MANIPPSIADFRDRWQEMGERLQTFSHRLQEEGDASQEFCRRSKQKAKALGLECKRFYLECDQRQKSAID